MRSNWACLASALFLGSAACGGGGGGGSAAVAGTIVSRNGSTANLSGVTFACTESGSTDTSDVRGKFSIDIPHGTTFHLTVSDPAASEPATGHDCSTTDGSTAPNADISGDSVEIGEVEDGESCDIEVEIENGQIVGVSVTKGSEGHDKRSGDGVLLPATPGEAYGEVEVADEAGCLEIHVGAEGLAPGAYDVSLVGPNAESLAIGQLLFDEKGEAHLAWDSCTAGVLPFGASTPEDLAGTPIEVRDSGGVLVLSGELPAIGAAKADGGKDGEGDGNKGDGGTPDDGGSKGGGETTK